MKKILLMSALVLVIATSMVSGTLASYSAGISGFPSGPIVAKNFVLVGTGDSEFQAPVTIAPKGEKPKTFTIANYSDTDIGNPSEVAMNGTFTVSLSGGVLSPIEPLTVDVYKVTNTTPTLLTPSSGSIIKGVGTVTYDFTLPNTATKDTYKVVVTWPDDSTSGSGLVDNNYIGNTYGTVLTVSASATQLGT